jgi:hypothetical protein
MYFYKGFFPDIEIGVRKHKNFKSAENPKTNAEPCMD